MNKSPSEPRVSSASAQSATPSTRSVKRAAPDNPRTKRGRAASTLGNQSSAQTNRRAAVILEVLAGVRLPSEAAQALGVSVTHYYLMERKALGGLLRACEVQPKGRSGPTAQEQVKRLERELEQCRRACQRQAALVRATQRAVGLPAAASTSDTANKTSRKKKKNGSSPGRRRRRRPAVRALRAAEALERNSSLSQESDELQPSSAGESIGCPGVAQEGP